MVLNKYIFFATKTGFVTINQQNRINTSITDREKPSFPLLSSGLPASNACEKDRLLRSSIRITAAIQTTARSQRSLPHASC